MMSSDALRPWQFNEDSHFGFAGGGSHNLFKEGPFFGGKTTRACGGARAGQDSCKMTEYGIEDDTVFTFVVQRRGDKLIFSADGNILYIATAQSAKITSLGLRPCTLGHACPRRTVPAAMRGTLDGGGVAVAAPVVTLVCHPPSPVATRCRARQHAALRLDGHDGGRL